MAKTPTKMERAAMAAREKRSMKLVTIGGGVAIAALLAVVAIPRAITSPLPGTTTFAAGPVKVAIERPQTIGFQISNSKVTMIDSAAIGFDVGFEIKSSDGSVFINTKSIK